MLCVPFGVEVVRRVPDLALRTIVRAAFFCFVFANLKKRFSAVSLILLKFQTQWVVSEPWGAVVMCLILGWP